MTTLNSILFHIYRRNFPVQQEWTTLLVNACRESKQLKGEGGPREVSQIPGLLLFGGLGALRHLKG